MYFLAGDKVEDDIRSWLSPPDPWKNHNTACESRHSGTAAWFLQSKSFSEWKSSGLSSLLWVHGKRQSLFGPYPSVGLTVLPFHSGRWEKHPLVCQPFGPSTSGTYGVGQFHNH
jgi:hypothetical protein